MQTAIHQVTDLIGADFAKCESPSLRLEKFVSITKGDKTVRRQEIQAVVALANQKEKDPSCKPVSHPRCVTIEAYLLSNLIVNQSGGVLENAGLCLDKLHGYPYIPGSALKGVASAAAYEEWREKKADTELADRIVKVFGFPTGHKELDNALRSLRPEWKKGVALSGNVSFLAAIPNPKGKCGLTLDIATSHHAEYYQGKKEVATDDEQPIPLVFPAVQAGSEFLFVILPLRNATDDVLQDARRWLEKALTDLGVGAKTAAGMGWFALGPDPERAKSEASLKMLERQKAEAEKKKREQEQAEAAARETRAQDAKKQADDARAKAAVRASQPFAELGGKPWKKLKSEIQDVYVKSGKVFSLERRQELFDFLKAEEKVRRKDLKGDQSVKNWLGEELYQKLLEEKAE